MDLVYILRNLFCLLFPYLASNTVLSANPTDVPPDPSIDGVIKRIKKGLSSFTDCGVDTLLKHCNQENAMNFECFRTLGSCISKSIRDALIDNEEDSRGTEEL